MPAELGNSCDQSDDQIGVQVFPGDFVTARLRYSQNGVRQGVYLGGGETTFFVLGQSGTVYPCAGQPSLVPYKNLWGNTKDFVDQWRELHCKPGGYCENYFGLIGYIVELASLDDLFVG